MTPQNGAIKDENAESFPHGQALIKLLCGQGQHQGVVENS
jgi:hypothetical protein